MYCCFHLHLQINKAHIKAKDNSIQNSDRKCFNMLHISTPKTFVSRSPDPCSLFSRLRVSYAVDKICFAKEPNASESNVAPTIWFDQFVEYSAFLKESNAFLWSLFLYSQFFHAVFVKTMETFRQPKSYTSFQTIRQENSWLQRLFTCFVYCIPKKCKMSVACASLAQWQAFRVHVLQSLQLANGFLAS